jgi:hypothetical protein
LIIYKLKMLSKFAIATSALGLASADTFHFSNASHTREAALKLIRGSEKVHPQVREGDCRDAGAAVERLKEGPANIPRLEYYGEPYEDASFAPPDALFWDGYETDQAESDYDAGLADGTYTW